MDHLVRDLLVTILKDTINELIVTNRGRYIPSDIIPKQPIPIRFKSKLHESVYKQMDPFQLSGEKLNEIRLEWEIHTIITILSKTLNEIHHHSKYDSLLATIEILMNEIAEETELTAEYKKNSELLKELRKQLKNHVSNAEVKIHCRQEMLNTLKNELDNIKRINGLELNLVLRWEKTRLSQAIMLGKIEADELLTEISELECKIDKETRIALELDNLAQLELKKFHNLTEYWKKKHNDEMLEWTEKMTKTRNNIKQINDENDKHRQIYTERQLFIDDYLAKKAEEQRLIDFQLNRVRSAIRIQAWWRGTMVRRCLGPYKKKRKGKKSRKGK